MVNREKRFYSEEFKERALTAYRNSNESISKIAFRFGISRDTFSSWVYRRRTALASPKSATLAGLNSTSMKAQSLSPEAMEARIIELKHQLLIEKMRSEGLSKMIEIAERDLQIDIRKKLVPNSP